MCASRTEENRRSYKHKRNFFQLMCHWLKQFLIFLHGLVDLAIDYLFGLYYNETTRKHIPNVDQPFLTESALSLARKIRNRELKSEDVVKASIARITQVNGILNAVVDERYTAALEEARAADKLIESGEWTSEDLQRARPFHGVPFTTKDSTAVKGLHHTIGLVCRRNEIAPEDAQVITLMRQAGAIPLAVTNVPELCMWYETRCNLHGQTNNPYDTNRMVGGSSGGESSILAACGSPFGIGTDIGGSIRMPAFFCGIFGHKPTTGLTPLRGLSRRTGHRNEENSMVVAGPMSRHAEDLAVVLAILVSGSNKPSLNLSTKVELRQVKVYYMEDDGGDLRVSPVCAELRGSMRRAIAHLREVTAEPPRQIHLPGMKYGYRLWRYMMSKEPEILVEELTNRQGAVIWWAETLRMLLGHSEYTLPSILRLIDLQLPQEKQQWAEEKLKNLLEDLKRELGNDGVLLYPSHPYTALYHYSTFLRPFNFSYTAVINTLNVPATQVPLGLSKDGLPLGVQVVSTPYNDRLCLAVAEELQRGCGGWVPPFKTS